MAAAALATGRAGPAARADEPSLAGAAAGDVAAARAAFSAGREAFARGDAYTAAERFAQADALVPADAALESALRAALRADAPRLGMELVTRAQERGARGSVAAAAAKAGTVFAARAARVTVTCDACRSLTIDGTPTADGVTAWLLVGPHLVDATWRDASARRLVNVVAGTHARLHVRPQDGGAAVVAVAPPAEGGAAAQPAARAAAGATGEPSDGVERSARQRAHAIGPARAALNAEITPVQAPAHGRQPDGMSPAWFWIGAGATVALGAATVASAVATAEQHSEYQQSPTTQGAAAGKAAQTRTAVLLGFSGAAAVSTAALGLFAVRWGGTSASVGATPDGASAGVRGRF